MDTLNNAAGGTDADLSGTGATALGIDIMAPCPHEAVLLQEPVVAMARRLHTLLTEFPDHPVLAQLAAICTRLMALSLSTTPLKTALTGLELLLSRAQVCYLGCDRGVRRV
jgi:hypothetical protein